MYRKPLKINIKLSIDLVKNNSASHLINFCHKRDRVKSLIRKNKRLDEINFSWEVKNSKKFFSRFCLKNKFKNNIKAIRVGDIVTEGDKNIS